MNVYKLILNSLLATVMVLLMDPGSFYGLSFHEWAGLIIGLMFILHKVLNWYWIKKVTTGFFRRAPVKARINYLLDVLLLAGMVLMILSGIAIARTIDFSWLHIGGSRIFWRTMHTSSTFLTFALFGIHVGFHWNWIRQRFNFKRIKNG